MDASSVGVYAHVPFCERVCPYCDFAVVGVRRLAPAAEAGYVAAVTAELARRQPAFAGRSLASLYLGGGTPSLLEPRSVAALVDAVFEAFAPEPEVEVTLEANPGTLERERLAGFRAAGVNRLSIGAQSFDDATLKRLGRAHRADEVRETFAAARRAGFADVSLDLICAAPGQSEEAFERDLAEAIALGPEHVSIYELTLEPGTPFAAAAARGRLAVPGEEAAAGMLELAEARLLAAGYERYELSNYARPGHRARHNRRYWERRPVLGLGVGAFSTDPPGPGAPFGIRRANTRRLDVYLERIGAGTSAEAGTPEVLDAHTARGEAVFLALRCAEGLDAAQFRREFGAAPRGFWDREIQALVAGELVCEAPDGSLRLTRRGRLVSDGVFEYFV